MKRITPVFRPYPKVKSGSACMNKAAPYRLLLCLAGLMTAVPTLAAGVPQEARAAVERTVIMMGGADALAAVRSFQAQMKRVDFHQVDSDHPYAPFLPDYSDTEQYTDIRRVLQATKIDMLDAGGTRESMTVIYRGPVEQLQLHYNDSHIPTRQMPAPLNWDMENPVALIDAALRAPDLTMTGHSESHGIPHDLVSFSHAGRNVTLELNQYNHYLDAVVLDISAPSNIAKSVWGDFERRIEFSDWRMEAGGLRYPYVTVSYFRGTMDSLQTLVTLNINATESELAQLAAKPPDVAAVLAPDDVDDIPLGDAKSVIQREGTEAAELAPGVLQIPGSWYTTLVRQQDGIVVIEAPISSGYSKRVLQEAARRYPGLPVKAVITTTNFWWHFAGIREYAARGIPIYALDQNRELIESALQAPHRTDPDDLSRVSKPPEVIPVSEPTVIGAGDNQLILYPIRTTSGQMMMVSLPARGILYTAEMVQPFGPNHALLYPQSLLELKENVDAYHVPVTSIIGMHMSSTPWSELLQSIQAAIAGKPQPHPT